MQSDLSDDEKKAKIAELLAVADSEPCADSEITEPVVDTPAVVEVETEGASEELTAEKIVELVEKITDSKLKKAMSDYKSTAKILNDSIDEVKAVVGDFDTAKITDSASVYKTGYEILTGCELSADLDAKTAFKMEVSKRRPKATITDSVSDNDSKIQKLASRFK